MYVLLETSKNVMLPYASAKGPQKIFTFVPGKNKVDDGIWKAVLKQNAQGYEIHYSKFLRPFETGFDTGTKPHLNDYSEEEMLEIIANVRSTDFLEYLLHIEHERKIYFKPRLAVVAAITAKLPSREIPLDELNRLGSQMREYARW
jgi:hypothetical protein